MATKTSMRLDKKTIDQVLAAVRRMPWYLATATHAEKYLAAVVEAEARAPTAGVFTGGLKIKCARAKHLRCRSLQLEVFHMLVCGSLKDCGRGDADFVQLSALLPSVSQMLTDLKCTSTAVV